MKMNPLGVDTSRFIICEDSEGQRIGFGQLRKLADNSDADPSIFNARPGTGDIEAGADDAAWDDLERELDDMPKGFVLPFTPEYKRLEERAALQRARRRARVAAAEASANPLWELASIFVEEDWRGRGVGSALIRQLRARHESSGRRMADVYLLTLDPTAGWYEQFGFARVAKEHVPASMAFEVTAGEALSAVLGNKLVCMRGGIERTR